MSHDVLNFSPIVEKKSFAHKQLDIPSSQFQLEIDYENLQNLPPENSEEIRRFVEANLLVVYEFIEQNFSEEQIFTRSWMIKFSPEGSLRAQGKVMVIPVKETLLALKHENTGQRKIMLSQIAHETIHNITDDEALPMLIELIFLMESNSNQRIRDIYDLFSENKLPNQYVLGIKTICEWLNMETSVFFEKLLANNLDLNQLRELLKKQVKIEALQQ